MYKLKLFLFSFALFCTAFCEESDFKKGYMEKSLLESWHICHGVYRKVEKLCIEQAVWTRQFITSELSKSPDASSAEKRLLRNQEDIGNSLIPYYGEKAATRAIQLLKDQEKIIIDRINAIKKNDTAAIQKVEERWHDNAREMATFLNSLNPYWSKKRWEDLFHQYLHLTDSEINSRLENRWSDDVAIFDKIVMHALVIADYWAMGLINKE